MRRIVLVGGRGTRLDVEVAQTRSERMRGLLRRERLPPGGALLIEGTSSVHTFGMRFPIEVAFLDGRLRVVALRRMPPGRLTLPRRGVAAVLECPAGTGLRVGDLLRPA